MRIVFIVLLATAAFASAQQKNLYLNAQLHWDFDREINTTTLELFHLDKLGTTFFFTDFDFDEVGQHGSYFEIARNFKVVPSSRGNLNLSVQYNDGTLELPEKVIPGAFLYGFAFDNLHVGPARLEFQTLARKEFATDLSWQLTLVWFAPMQPWLLFNGYVDVNGDQKYGGRTRVQSEPQLRFLWQPWSIGSEVEVSRNFLPAGTSQHPFEKDKWFAHPTVFVQYDF
jgi:hypothetical protein